MAITLERGGPLRGDAVEAILFEATGKSRIRKIIVSNGANKASTFNVWTVPDGGVAGTDNRNVQAYRIEARDVILFPIDAVLYPGDAVYVGSPGDSVIVFQCMVEVGIP